MVPHREVDVERDARRAIPGAAAAASGADIAVGEALPDRQFQLISEVVAKVDFGRGCKTIQVGTMAGASAQRYLEWPLDDVGRSDGWHQQHGAQCTKDETIAKHTNLLLTFKK